MQKCVETAKEDCAGMENPDIFMDLSAGGAGGRNIEKAVGVTTCLRPSHRVFSVTFPNSSRFLGPLQILTCVS